MKLHVLLDQTGEWLRGAGPDAEIVISCRVRLARNLSRFPFPVKAELKNKEELLSVIEKLTGESKFLKEALFLRLNKLDELDRQFLMERHLISREHAAGENGSAVIIGKRELVNIMVNEEDHLRLQVLHSGFQLQESWSLINELDNDLDKKLDFAFSSRLGYLTSCPTNVGTGLRASVMLHLPALVLTKQINQVLQAILKLGLAVRGLYGEGTEASGNLFQISNQVTLGKSEDEIISSLEKVIKQIIGHERNARKLLIKNNVKQVEDRVGRAYGILRNAHIISSKEAIELLSTLRMGVDLGLLSQVDRQTINELFLLTQPAHLQKIAAEKLSPENRDIKRSNLIREKLEEADQKQKKRKGRGK